MVLPLVDFYILRVRVGGTTALLSPFAPDLVSTGWDGMVSMAGFWSTRVCFHIIFVVDPWDLIKTILLSS